MVGWKDVDLADMMAMKWAEKLDHLEVAGKVGYLAVQKEDKKAEWMEKRRVERMVVVRDSC